MNKNQMKQYIIKQAVFEHELYEIEDKWSKEYLAEGKRENYLQWRNNADIARARWSIYRELIDLLCCEDEYYKALNEKSK